MIFRNHKSRQKKGRRLREYKGASTLKKLTDTLRHVVFEYDVKRENNDFSLNVYLNRRLYFQVLHRSHFPELAKLEEDVSFGLALYMPVSQLNKSQREQLVSIFKEESETFYFEEIPFDYYVIDIGRRIRYGSYLLSRIIKEVFYQEDVQNLSFKLFSEGKIPYIGLNKHPEKS